MIGEVEYIFEKRYICTKSFLYIIIFSSRILSYSLGMPSVFLLLQSGLTPDHLRLARHVLSVSPAIRSKPVRQEYVMVVS